MNVEKVILFQIYINSSYGDNEFSLSEFSEKFINEEIKNSFSHSISKLKFANAVEKLEKNEILKKSSRHHLTTLNSWRLTEKCKNFFEILSKKKVNDFEGFKSEFNLWK
tara:strand:- start:259 stop:585 length:327 start_codon:yes stop_codon:yes gene_type:complete